MMEDIILKLADSIKILFGKIRKNAMLLSLKTSSPSKIVYTNIELEVLYEYVKNIAEDVDFIYDKLSNADIRTIDTTLSNIRIHICHQRHRERYVWGCASSDVSKERGLTIDLGSAGTIGGIKYPGKTYDEITVSRLFEIVRDTNDKLDDAEKTIKNIRRVLDDLKKDGDHLSDSDDIIDLDSVKANNDINTIKNECSKMLVSIRNIHDDLSMLRITSKPDL